MIVNTCNEKLSLSSSEQDTDYDLFCSADSLWHYQYGSVDEGTNM